MSGGDEALYHLVGYIDINENQLFQLGKADELVGKFKLLASTSADYIHVENVVEIVDAQAIQGEAGNPGNSVIIGVGAPIQRVWIAALERVVDENIVGQLFYIRYSRTLLPGVVNPPS